MLSRRGLGFHFFFCVFRLPVHNWHGWQRLSVVIHTAVAWQTVNELACGEATFVHGARSFVQTSNNSNKLS